jgi:hypothetical protein
MRRTATISALVAGALAIFIGTARAEQPSAAPENPDPWAKLCDPGMKWEFEPLLAGKRTKKTGHEWPMIRIEATDQRTIGDAKVCRLKWFVVEEGKKPVDFDSKKVKKDMDTWGDVAPNWYDVQGAFGHIRRVAITPRGLYIIQMKGEKDFSDEAIAKEITRAYVNYPGKGASAKQLDELRKSGGGFRRWGLAAGDHEVWCYGYEDKACSSEDSECHTATCFERQLGLVSLYVTTRGKNFPEEFTFFTLLGFPEPASWREKPSAAIK